MKFMRKKILIFTDWYAPAWRAGGPIRSLMNFTAVWPFESHVYTGNYDLGELKPLNVETDTWIEQNENTFLYYQNLKKMNRSTVRSIIDQTQWDAIYINSLFSFWFSIFPLFVLKQRGLSNRVLLAPRGMLHQAALSQKSTKKKLFIGLAKFLGIWKDITWHATSAEEVKRIQLIVSPNARIKQFSNVPFINERKSFPVWTVHQHWIMVARISPEKGVLESMQWLGSHPNAHQVTLHIVGPIENKNYFALCEKWVSAQSHLKVIFHGAMPMDEIIKLKEECHVFYSATKGENFGHAIAEALLSGMPVIISDRTPWQGLLSKNVGWEVAWKESSFHSAFDAWFGQNEMDYLQKLDDLKVHRAQWRSNFAKEAKWDDLFSF